MDRAAVEQQLFSQRRLAGVRMADDRERAPSADGVVESGVDGHEGNLIERGSADSSLRSE
jgi:hypothetical protein